MASVVLNLLKSSGWTFGGPTAYRLIGRVTGLCLVVIVISQFLGRSDSEQLPSSSSRELVEKLVCLSLEVIISEGHSSLQRQRCVGSIK